MRAAAAVFLGLVGCDAAGAAGVGGAFVTANYFLETEAWTWRDDGDTGSVDDATVLRGELSEEGEVEVRRGSRFVDGDAVGGFVWDLTATDLLLTSWDWSGEGSGSSTIFARNGGRSGDVVTNLQGSCVTDIVSDFATSYGVFDFVLRATCDGTPAPSGEYWFAEGFGLVSANADPIVMDLVAPR